ncbi:MAG: GIY-YIG nuclease family protein [Longimonas sp.]|uniref:GIY-YIG nuclease family protein n=1 Tax=Longimonas sp. TaxID=2039626 RepID=UPI00397484B6
MSRPGYVYILASRRNGTLYIGVTSALEQRVWRHRQGMGSAFTTRYGVTRLVYYEVYDDIQTAIEREKQLKGWRRAWKIDLIETENPTWRDLYTEL